MCSMCGKLCLMAHGCRSRLGELSQSTPAWRCRFSRQKDLWMARSSEEAESYAHLGHQGRANSREPSVEEPGWHENRDTSAASFLHQQTHNLHALWSPGAAKSDTNPRTSPDSRDVKKITTTTRQECSKIRYKPGDLAIQEAYTGWW